MPYVSDDLISCCSFVLRCCLHVNRQSRASLSNGQEPHIEMQPVYNLYHSNLSKYLSKRDSPFPFNIFSRALVYPWPDAGFLLETLIDSAFKATVPNRKLQAIQLITAIFRNSTALMALSEQDINQQVQRIIDNSTRVYILGHFQLTSNEILAFSGQ